MPLNNLYLGALSPSGYIYPPPPGAVPPYFPAPGLGQSAKPPTVGMLSSGNDKMTPKMATVPPLPQASSTNGLSATGSSSSACSFAAALRNLAHQAKEPQEEAAALLAAKHSGSPINGGSPSLSTSKRPPPLPPLAYGGHTATLNSPPVVTIAPTQTLSQLTDGRPQQMSNANRAPSAHSSSSSDHVTTKHENDQRPQSSHSRDDDRASVKDNFQKSSRLGTSQSGTATTQEEKGSRGFHPYHPESDLYRAAAMAATVSPYVLDPVYASCHPALLQHHAALQSAAALRYEDPLMMERLRLMQAAPYLHFAGGLVPHPALHPYLSTPGLYPPDYLNHYPYMPSTSSQPLDARTSHPTTDSVKSEEAKVQDQGREKEREKEKGWKEQARHKEVDKEGNKFGRHHKEEQAGHHSSEDSSRRNILTVPSCFRGDKEKERDSGHQNHHRPLPSNCLFRPHEGKGGSISQGLPRDVDSSHSKSHTSLANQVKHHHSSHRVHKQENHLSKSSPLPALTSHHAHTKCSDQSLQGHSKGQPHSVSSLYKSPHKGHTPDMLKWTSSGHNMDTPKCSSTTYNSYAAKHTSKGSISSTTRLTSTGHNSNTTTHTSTGLVADTLKLLSAGLHRDTVKQISAGLTTDKTKFISVSHNTETHKNMYTRQSTDTAKHTSTGLIPDSPKLISTGLNTETPKNTPTKFSKDTQIFRPFENHQPVSCAVTNSREKDLKSTESVVYFSGIEKINSVNNGTKGGAATSSLVHTSSNTAWPHTLSTNLIDHCKKKMDFRSLAQECSQRKPSSEGGSASVVDAGTDCEAWPVPSAVHASASASVLPSGVGVAPGRTSDAVDSRPVSVLDNRQKLLCRLQTEGRCRSDSEGEWEEEEEEEERQRERMTVVHNAVAADVVLSPNKRALMTALGLTTQQDKKDLQSEGFRKRRRKMRERSISPIEVDEDSSTEDFFPSLSVSTAATDCKVTVPQDTDFVDKCQFLSGLRLLPVAPEHRKVLEAIRQVCEDCRQRREDKRKRKRIHKLEMEQEDLLKTLNKGIRSNKRKLDEETSECSITSSDLTIHPSASTQDLPNLTPHSLQSSLSKLRQSHHHLSSSQDTIHPSITTWKQQYQPATTQTSHTVQPSFTSLLQQHLTGHGILGLPHYHSAQKQDMETREPVQNRPQDRVSSSGAADAGRTGVLPKGGESPLCQGLAEQIHRSVLRATLQKEQGVNAGLVQHGTAELNKQSTVFSNQLKASSHGQRPMYSWPGIEGVLEAYLHHTAEREEEGRLLAERCRQLHTQNVEFSRTVEVLNLHLQSLEDERLKRSAEHNQLEQAVDSLKKCLTFHR